MPIWRESCFSYRSSEEMAVFWKDALMRLHVDGWDSDDIDAACEDLREAYEIIGALSLTAATELSRLLGVSIDPGETEALVTLAGLRGRECTEARGLASALYDLDAFAYEYAGDD